MTPVRTITGSANADLLAMPGTGEVFSRTDSSGTVVPLHDLAGSTIGLVDGTGKIVTQYAYQPFGQPSVSGANNANPFQFAGMEYDSTGLYHTWARCYSPGLQRFLSEDPSGLAGGNTNIFAYVHDNPVNTIDPLGLGPIGIGGGCPGGDCAPAPGGANAGLPPPGPSISVYSGGQGVQGLNGLNGVNTLTLEKLDAAFAVLGSASVLGGFGVGYVAIALGVTGPAIIVVGVVGAAIVGGTAFLLFIESSTSSSDSNMIEHVDIGNTDYRGQMNFQYNQQDPINVP